MSAYVNFYLKRDDDDYYQALDDFSRGSYLFQAISDAIPYGKTIEFNDDIYKEAYDWLQGKIEAYNELNNDDKKMMQFIKEMNGDFSERMEKVEDINMMIRERNDDIEYIKADLYRLITFHEIAETLLMGDRPARLYVGYESDPNYEEA